MYQCRTWYKCVSRVKYNINLSWLINIYGLFSLFFCPQLFTMWNWYWPGSWSRELISKRTKSNRTPRWSRLKPFSTPLDSCNSKYDAFTLSDCGSENKRSLSSLNMAYLHWRRRTRKRIPNPMATLYYAALFTLYGLRLGFLLTISAWDRNPSPYPNSAMCLSH